MRDFRFSDPQPKHFFKFLKKHFIISHFTFLVGYFDSKMIKVIIHTKLLLLFCIIVGSASARRDWSNLNLDEVEREWDIDDDLDNGDDHFINQRTDKYFQETRDIKMQEMQDLLENGVQPTDPEYMKMSSELNQAGKPAMIFAKMYMKREEGKRDMLPNQNMISNWNDFADICDEWHVSCSNGYLIQGS